MSDQRPTAAPELLATLIESTPERVRKRLDREPNAAAGWNWRMVGETWTIETGGETVTLPLGHVRAVEQVRCTCLLAPRCFHVLATLTSLKTENIDAALVEATSADEETPTEPDEDALPVDAGQKRAAQDTVAAIGQLLRVGAANAGLVVQFALLRAAHQCRAQGLHRLASLGLRVVAGVAEFRSRAAASDPDQMASDTAEALETANQLLRAETAPAFWFGTVRRRQRPVRPRKLHGLFAEPIVTRSGFAGAAVYFLGEDDQIYSASDVKPGEARQARDTYHGGIEIGPLIQPAKQLARRQYLGTDLTASIDGRLGRGKSIKVVDQGPSSWDVDAVRRRFERPLADQWNAVYAHATTPADARPAGWDFLFINGTVLGVAGPELLVRHAMAGVLRLAIESESEVLFFRENLRLLGHAPGLQLRIIARANLLSPDVVFPLAGAPVDNPAEGCPRLDLPEPLTGRVCLGVDELQRHYLANAQRTPVVLNATGPVDDVSDPLHPLHRRWIAAVFSGTGFHRSINAVALAADNSQLSRAGFKTAAALTQALGQSILAPAHAVDCFLAAAIYLRSTRYELARRKALGEK